MCDPTNPFAALIEEESDENKLEQGKEYNSGSNEFENIFGFTLSKTASEKRPLVYLEELATSINTTELNQSTVEHALFERLFLSNPKQLVFCKIKLDSDLFDERVINYLFSCYSNAVNDSTINEKTKETVTALVMRNVVTTLKQPDLFDRQNIFQQFYKILTSNNMLAVGFFEDVCTTFKNDEDGKKGMQEPFQQILKIIHIDVAQSDISTVNPNIWNVLDLFCNREELADILLHYCTPKENIAGLLYANTLLGALLSISALPKVANGSYEFFTNPLDKANMVSTEPMLWSSLDRLTSNIHGIILSLLKCNTDIKNRTLVWLGRCLHANADRGKLWSAQAPELNPSTYSSVSDGFMINLGNVLLRLCQPFCSDPKDKKILKVDPTYCAVLNEQCSEKGIHLPDMAKETCLVPIAEEGNTRKVSESYNFVTECFFLAHRAFDLGYRVTVDKLVALNQDLVRIERAYNEAVSQGGGTTDVVDTLRERLKTEMSKYLSIKAVLLEPTLLQMTFDFISATAHWLTQVALHTDSNGKTHAPLTPKEITFPLPNSVPETLSCIPEFVIENTVCFLVFLRRFNPKVFEEEGYDHLHPILSFILTYMGSPERMKNPHLRARLAEALEAFLPYHKDEPPGLNTLGSFQREKLFLEYPHRKEIVRNLLSVFVGIEMTGQSVQFEQKFNYRRPMYIIMDYLWQIEEYQNYFVELAKEAESNMEDVNPPLFLRFVNLLMNDAVFLLDEALSNMAKLREMQTARDNGEWNNLSAQERAQNLAYMQQTGRIAKFDNILGKDTIQTLEKLTSKITIVFTHSTMVDRVAAMLNYFLYNLVGPKKKNFKVKDQKEYHFDPADTVMNICKIYVNLKESDSFCLAVSQDGRSYSPQLFTLAEDVLVRIGGGLLVGEVQDVAIRVAKKTEEHQANEEAIAEAPDHFLDPIMSTLMTDPVILPSSKQTVDRSTIARHLLSDQTDPFNRAPLTMDQVIPNTELAAEIRKWLDERKK